MNSWLDKEINDMGAAGAGFLIGVTGGIAGAGMLADCKIKCGR